MRRESERSYLSPVGNRRRKVICKGLQLLQETYKTVGATTTTLAAHNIQYIQASKLKHVMVE
jgi:hypothetical protein